jgi:GH15 family glucan-1,4-alpha-glucosidase
LIVRSDIHLAPRGDALHGSVRVRAGQRKYVRLAFMDGDVGVIPQLGGAADHDLQATLSWWQNWSDHCTYQGAYRDAVLRSAITLKLLSFALSGAIVAAPTTSLPEDIGGTRNWDYRYCWLRDAGLTMRALVGLGFHQEARTFLSWLLHATRLTWPKLQVVYDVYGRTRLRERLLANLEGYCRSQPVRVGNNASAQDQLDIYGEVVLAIDAFVQGGGELDVLEARMVAGLGKVVCRQWRDADHGIWEIRDAKRQYTFSKVTSWMALDGLLKMNEAGVVALGANAERFRHERQAILDTIEQRGFNTAIGSYVSELDGGRVDASLLLMACLGYKDARDPRMMSTYDCIARRLERDGLFYRYEAEYDSLGGREGAFGICSFWAIDNLVQRGEIENAERRFEHLLKYANDLGLFGEEIDPNSGAVLGNFPQAFTHVGLINAAMAIQRTSGARHT